MLLRALLLRQHCPHFRWWLRPLGALFRLRRSLGALLLLQRLALGALFLLLRLPLGGLLARHRRLVLHRCRLRLRWRRCPKRRRPNRPNRRPLR